jgi:hypothetical protein
MQIVGRRSNFPSVRRNHSFSPVARLQFRLSSRDKVVIFFLFVRIPNVTLKLSARLLRTCEVAGSNRGCETVVLTEDSCEYPSSLQASVVKSATRASVHYFFQTILQLQSV